MESDLHPKSVVNLLLKYADDTNLLVAENTDVELADELRHVMQWTDDSKMITKQSKTNFKRNSLSLTQPKRTSHVPFG